MRDGRDKAQWRHTSSLICVLAQIHAPKGKRYKPDEFNPWVTKGSPHKFGLTKDTISLLKVFVDGGPKDQL